LLLVGCSLNPQGELPGAGEGKSAEANEDVPALPGLDDAFTDGAEPGGPDEDFDDSATDDSATDDSDEPSDNVGSPSAAGPDAGTADGGLADSVADGGVMIADAGTDAASDPARAEADASE
jgi:hypothetical protein